MWSIHLVAEPFVDRLLVLQFLVDRAALEFLVAAAVEVVFGINCPEFLLLAHVS